MMDFHIGFDPGSLSALTQLAGFGALLDPEVQSGLTQVGTLLVNATQANTWSAFANPTGQLADSIYFYVISPTEVAVAVGVPYAQRRERGFSGMTDALGRFYPYDPAKPYAQPAVDQHQQEITEIMEVAVNGALGRIVA
jgi:hypothetical protein